METVTLKASLRTDQGKGSARRLRSEGRIPSVAYGKTSKGEHPETIAIAIEADALRDILVSDRGRNTIIELEVDGGTKVAVMIKEYEVNPLTRKLIHADFQRIDPDLPIVVEVPFVTVGKSKGEQEGGTLLTTVRSLKLRCLPTNIPNAVEHDVSSLTINDEVKVKELVLPEKVEVLMSPERKLVVVQPPRVVVEAAAEGAAEAEGEKEGEAKKEGEG
jgi:large subunit ribosomal protein L25